MSMPSISGYEPRTRIAAGGMGEVFLAVRTADARQVAIKIASPDADAQTQLRLRREYRLLQAIDHPNVVKVLECDSAQGRPYMVMDYVSGQSLRERMRAGQPLAWDQIADILQQLTEGLAALHARDILHRDVKPENVLIDASGRVTLIDLSVGGELSELGTVTRHDQFLGTVDYMAPEQRHGIEVDQRTDQYSLAAVTFEMLTGHCCLGEFRRPSELNPDLPAAVDTAVLRGLERDPSDRYPSIQDFTAAVLAAAPEMEQRPRSSLAIGVAAACLIAAACLLPKMSGRGPHVQQPATPTIHNPTRIDVNNSVRYATHRNSLGMQFVQLPPGTFSMGSSAQELARHFTDVPTQMSAETPKHEVTLTRSFWMGAHEVSVAQFRVFVQETGYQTTSEESIATHGRSPRQPTWQDPRHFEAKDDLPVCAVSWHDASQFCAWLSRKEGLVYRLPTEAEWEYACRAGTTGDWFCAAKDLPTHAVLARVWHAGPRPVGERKPNAWGLFDMHGNVMEWCQDRFVPRFYECSPAQDPICQRRHGRTDLRVLRGAGYKAMPRAARSTVRRGHESAEAHEDRGHAIGFRVVCDDFPARLAARNP